MKLVLNIWRVISTNGYQSISNIRLDFNAFYLCLLLSLWTVDLYYCYQHCMFNCCLLTWFICFEKFRTIVVSVYIHKLVNRFVFSHQWNKLCTDKIINGIISSYVKDFIHSIFLMKFNNLVLIYYKFYIHILNNCRF